MAFNNNNISSILEFGGSYGINLEPFLEQFTNIEVTSIDTNNSVKRLEKKYKNYQGIIGSDNILRDITSLKYDIAFCCSVFVNTRFRNLSPKRSSVPLIRSILARSEPIPIIILNFCNT